MHYRIKGKILLEDYVKFANYHLYQSLFGGFKKFFYIFLGSALFLAYIMPIARKLIDSVEVGSAELLEQLIKLTLFIAIALIIFLTVRFRLPNKYKKSFESNKLLHDEQKFEISESDIKVSSLNSNSILAKDRIHKIVFNEDAIYIFISTIQAFVLPKHFFASDDEFAKVKELVRKSYTI